MFGFSEMTISTLTGKKPPRKGDFKELKIQNLSWGSLTPDLLEAYAFGARSGNRSVFTVDPRRILRRVSIPLFHFILKRTQGINFSTSVQRK